MKKIIVAGMVIVSITLLANEMAKEVSKQQIEKKVLDHKQANTKVQEKAVAKQEVKIKSQNYPRGNIATH